MRWLIVREDLIDAEDNICEQQRTLDRIAFAASDTPGSEKTGASYCDTYQCRIDVADLREPSDPPKEVNRA